MLGRDHALSGALAFTAVAPLLHVTGVPLAAGMALTAGAGVLPDLDEPGSTIARTFGFLTGAFAWIVHKISGGHRKGTHSLVGVALMTVASLAAGSGRPAPERAPGTVVDLVPPGHPGLAVLGGFAGYGHRRSSRRCCRYRPGRPGDLEGLGPGPGPNVQVLAVCVTLGMLADLAGDMCTHDGCPLLYPLSRHESACCPRPCGHHEQLAEHWIVTPLLLAGLAYFFGGTPVSPWLRPATWPDGVIPAASGCAEIDVLDAGDIPRAGRAGTAAAACPSGFHACWVRANQLRTAETTSDPTHPRPTSSTGSGIGRMARQATGTG